MPEEKKIESNTWWGDTILKEKIKQITRTRQLQGRGQKLVNVTFFYKEHAYKDSGEWTRLYIILGTSTLFFLPNQRNLIKFN